MKLSEYQRWYEIAETTSHAAKIGAGPIDFHSAAMAAWRVADQGFDAQIRAVTEAMKLVRWWHKEGQHIGEHIAVPI